MGMGRGSHDCRRPFPSNGGMTEPGRILGYQAPGPPGGPVSTRAEWRDVVGGVELVLPPPPQWRLGFVPATVLAVLTGPVMFSVAWLIGNTTLNPNFRANPSRHLPELALAVGVAVPGGAAWAWGAAVLRRRLRGWPPPSLVRVAGGTLSVESPEGTPRRTWRAASVTSIQLGRCKALAPSILPRIELRVVTDDGKVDVVVIPSGGREDLPKIESRLRDALGLGRRNLSPARLTAAVAPVPEGPRHV